MSKRRILRRTSFLMLVIAVLFVACAVSNPQLGHAVYIGTFRFGADQWRVCYAAYVTVMIGLFVASFFVKKNPK